MSTSIASPVAVATLAVGAAVLGITAGLPRPAGRGGRSIVLRAAGLALLAGALVAAVLAW